MSENEYKISLGVEVDISDIKNQINKTKVDPIKISLDIDNSKKEIQDIKKNLKGIGFKDSSITKIVKDLEKMNLTINKITTSIKKDGNIEISVKGIDKLKNAVSIVRGYDKKGNPFTTKSISQSFKTEVDKINEAFNVLKQKQKEINSLNFKLAGLDAKENVSEIKELKSQIASLKKEYEKLYSSYDGKFEGSQTDELIKGWIDAENKINHLKSQMADTRADLAKDIKFKIDTGSFEKDISDIETKIKSFGNVSKELKNSIAQLKSNRTRMSTALGKNDIDSAIKSYERYSKLLKTVNNQIGISGNAQKSTNEDFNKLAKIGQQVDNLKKKIATLDPKINTEQIAELSNQLKEAETSYNSLFNKLKGKLTSTQIDSLTESAKKAENEMNELNSRMLDTSNANVLKEINQEMTNFVKLQSKISGMQTKIDELKIVGGSENEIAFLEKELKELENTYAQLMHTFQQKLVINADIVDMGDIAKFDEEITTATQKAEKELAEFEAKLADTRAKMAKGIELKLGSDGKFATQVAKVKNDLEKLSDASNDLKIDIEQLDAAIRAMNLAKENGDVEGLISSYKQYEAILERVKNQIKQTKIAEQNSASVQKLNDDIALFQGKIDSYLTKHSAAAKDFGDRLLELKSKAQDCDRVTLNHLESEFKQIDKAIEAAGKKTQTFGDKLKTQFEKYKTYFSVATLFMYATQGLKDMFEQVKAIDSAMTELKKVTNETDASYNQFLGNAASRAKEIGTTIEGLVSSTADFARLGYGFEDAQGLAEVANIYAVVGDEIEGVEGATENLISTLTAFKKEANGLSSSDFAMNVVDKMNEVADTYSISSGGLGEALKRSASSMETANNSLDETIALITAANEVVQDPEIVGQAFKTISMRIRGAKTELEDAGESTDGMAESTASLRQEIMALSGVDIMLNENTFKSTYQILDELSHKWENLSDIAQASIIELVAGKHRGNVVSSLMSNFDVARSALETSMNSAGSAMREHERWSQSLEAKLNSLKASWQGLSQAFLSSDFLKVALDGVIGLVDGISKLIDTFGTLPTLVTGFTLFNSAFNNAGFFKTLTSDLDGFVNKIGFANRSFADLTNAFNAGKTGTGLKGFIEGLSSVGNSLSKTLTKTDISNIQAYNDLIDQCVPSQAAWYRTMQTSSTAAQDLVEAANGGKVSLSKLTAATNGSKVALIGAKVAAVAFNAALTIGASLIISAAIKAFDEWYVSADELAEKIDEVTSKYKEQHNTLSKLKGDYDTSNESSMISKYGKLSKGVDALGENVSLTADEYAEYQSIVETIAGQIPSLVSGYNSQGDAILSCAGSVDKLSQAYKDLVVEQNKALLDTGEDVFKDFSNDLEKSRTKYDTSIGNVKELEKLMNMSDEELESISNTDTIMSIGAMLEEYGFEKRNVLGSGEAGWESSKDYVINAIKESRAEIKGILDDASADLNAYAEDLGLVTEAYFSTAFIGGDGSDIGDYSHMSEQMQNIITQVTSGFDSDFYTDFLSKENPYEALAEYYDNMLSAFDKLGSGNKAKLEAAFDLQTQFNGGKISYGEYVKGIREASDIIDGLGLDEEVTNQLKLSLNTDEVEKDYDALAKRLTDISTKDLKKNGHFSGISEAIKSATEEAEEFLNGLTASEYAVAVDLIVDNEIDLNNFNLDSLREYIEKQARLNEAMNFTIAMDVETESIEALNTAMSESVSGAGLSSEAISALKGRYAELASQGYDLSLMFEETSNGIHLNRSAVNELEQALASQKLSETQGNLDVLKNRYDELTEEIKNCTDAGERANLYSEQQQVAQKINDLATLASQYEGLTSAYQAWQSVESSGSERDMYESIIEGFETVGDEISRGWYDDGTIKFLELLTGKTDLVGKSAKELKEIYNGLDKEIKNTSYSVRDFFTVDEDGNSTSAGAYNFLKALEQLEKSDTKSSVLGKAFKDIENIDKLVQRDADGRIVEFDFNVVGGDKAVADALGISEEMVQIMQRALDDAGFVVTLDGKWTLLADLKTSAEEANNTLKKLKTEGLEELKNVSEEDLNFDFDASSLTALNDEFAKANKVLDQFKDKNGQLKKDAKGNLVKGAQEALDIAMYYQATIDKLTEPVYMQLETNQVEKNLQEPLKKMQEFEGLVKEKHMLTLAGDTKGLKETEQKMDDIAQWLENLDGDTKVELDIDGLSTDEIKDKLEKGEIEIPATVDIQLEMSEDIKDMRLLMMQQLGLVSENEVKLKIGYEIDDSTVDKLDDKEQEVVIKYIEENEEAWNKLSEEEREAVVKIVADGTDIENWEAEEKEALVKYVVDGGEVEGWSPEEKQAFAKYLVDGGEVEGWSPEAKDAFVKYLVDGGDPDKFDPDDKESWVVYKKDTTEPDSYAPRNPNALVKYGKDSSIPDGYNPDDPDATVKYGKDSLIPDSYIPLDPPATVVFDKDTSIIDSYDPPNFVRTVTYKIKEIVSKVASGGKSKAAQRTGSDPDGSGVNGTANVNGTIGRAFKQGSWGTKNSGTALVGELGREVLVRDGRYYTIGDDGAEFIKYKKGDIIFNHVQSEELFKNGRVTSGGGRAKALADGTALVSGTAFSKGSGGGEEAEVKSIVVGTNKNTGKSYTKSTDSKDDFEEIVDWIEIAISRIEREIDNLDQKANNIYKSWSSRNKALASEISEVGDEITLQQKAYDEYMRAANGVGLSSSWAKKVREGKVDIETIKDETLKEKISDYQNWFEKALACKDAIEELKEKEAELYAQRVENVSKQYEGILGVIEHEKNIIEEYISQNEANAQLVSGEYYKALASNERETITQLEKEKATMLKELQTAMTAEDNPITKGPEAWYDMVAQIDDVTLAIAQSQTKLKEYDQTLQQISWESFDLLQEKISAVAEESEFLIELLSDDKLYDDNGQLTDSGMATMGLHGQNYNTNMYQADMYGAEAERLKKELAKDPFDTDLEKRYRDMVSLQQEHILAAEGEKEAIRDMVEEGINLELDALQERIDKYNESIDSQKD